MQKFIMRKVRRRR